MKRAQIFTLDLLIAVIILTAALLALAQYAPTKPAPARDDIERLSSLVTPGQPENWTVQTVVRVGFLGEDGRLDESKIATFAALTPEEQRRLLAVRSHAVTIRFRQNTTNLTLCSTCGYAPAAYDDLIPLTRYALLNATPTAIDIRLYRSA